MFGTLYLRISAPYSGHCWTTRSCSCPWISHLISPLPPAVNYEAISLPNVYPDPDLIRYQNEIIICYLAAAAPLLKNENISLVVCRHIVIRYDLFWWLAAEKIMACFLLAERKPRSFIPGQKVSQKPPSAWRRLAQRSSRYHTTTCAGAALACDSPLPGDFHPFCSAWKLERHISVRPSWRRTLRHCLASTNMRWTS